MSSLAHKAVEHVLRRIQNDPQVAYYFCDATESFELLTEAYAVKHNEDVRELRKKIVAIMKIEAPRCITCPPKTDVVLWSEHIAEEIYGQIETAKHRTYAVHGAERELLLAEIRGMELAHSIIRGEG